MTAPAAALFKGETAAELLPLDLIDASPTNPRTRMNPTLLAELAQSVGKHGVLQPILVRTRDARFEIVNGHRRVRAAQIAGLTEIPAVVRTLSDGEALEIQCIENLQREDLEPLDEAEGYERLHRTHGYSVEEIAEKLGKSRTYVYSRLKLTALCDDVREYLRSGHLTAVTALLVARIPVPSLQLEAAKDIIADDYGQAMSATEAAQHIRRRYMLRLQGAPFDAADAKLVPAAGACSKCPKRTGNQPELFGDITEHDTCTDPTCFAGKKTAALEQRATEAEAKGLTVIRGERAKAELGNFFEQPKHDAWVTLSDVCPHDNGGRTWGEVLGKKIKPILIERRKAEDFVAVLARDEAEAILRKKGMLEEPGESTDATDSDDPTDAKKDHRFTEQAAQDFYLARRHRLHLWRAIFQTWPRAISRTELEAVLEVLMRNDEYGSGEATSEIARVLGVPEETPEDEDSAAFEDRVLAAITDRPIEEWGRFIAAFALADSVFENRHDFTDLDTVAAELQIDFAATEQAARLEIEQEQAAKAAEVKAARPARSKKAKPAASVSDDTSGTA